VYSSSCRTNRKDKFLADLRKARDELRDDMPELRKVRRLSTASSILILLMLSY